MSEQMNKDIELIKSFLSRPVRTVTRERMPMMAMVEIFDGIPTKMQTKATRYTITADGRKLVYTYHTIDERNFDGAKLQDIRVFDAGEKTPWYSNQKPGLWHIPAHLRARLRIAAFMSRERANTK